MKTEKIVKGRKITEHCDAAGNVVMVENVCYGNVVEPDHNIVDGIDYTVLGLTETGKALIKIIGLLEGK